jgi:flagellar biosynthetic protein FliO
MHRKDGKGPRGILRAWLKKAEVSGRYLTRGLFLSMVFLIRTGSAAGDGEPGFPAGDMGMASLKMGAALFFVILMIFGLYYLSRKIRDGRFSLSKDPVMRMIGSLSIAPKRSIALVEVCGEWLVLGIGTETITLLRRFENPPVPTNEPLSSGTGTGGSFQSLLRRKIRRPPVTNGSIREKNETPG